MKISPRITTGTLANALNVSRRTIQRDIGELCANSKLTRDGDDHGGKWIVISNGFRGC